MKIKLPASATRAFHKAGLQIKKHSPEILVVTGVVGTVVSAVMACKATTKLHSVLDESKEKIDQFHKGVEEGKVLSEVNGKLEVVPYNQEDCSRDIAITYGQTALKLVKLYGPAIALGTVSITGILVGHNVLHKRNLALAAAYTAADKGFKEYRSRVVERFGEKLDKELLYNIKSQEVEETVVDEKGNETVVTKTVEVANGPIGQDFYTFCFDETSSCWVRDAERNKFFLMRQQEYANEKLRSKGYLFLNEVLDMVGIPRVRAGQAAGWMLDGNGDGYIDFGIADITVEANRNFMNCLEKSVWLNFNVDGDILANF